MSERDDLVSALKWALPLAELALESHRRARLDAGHRDIGAGTEHYGLFAVEAGARDAARTTLAKATGGVP